MRSDLGFSRCFRAGLAGLALLAIGVEARADVMRPTITYSTSIEFGWDGRPRDLPGVSFQGVENQTIQAATPFVKDSFPAELFDGSTVDFPLGKLLFNLPSEGSQYGGDSFNLTVRVDAIDGVQLAEPLTVSLLGQVEGSLSASAQSALTYGIVGSVLPPPYLPPLPVAGSFAHGNLAHTIILPDSTRGGLMFFSNQEVSLNAELISSTIVNTPEPSTWAIFSIAAIGTWYSHRRRLNNKTRQHSAA